jgi:hypothetical protein
MKSLIFLGALLNVMPLVAQDTVRVTRSDSARAKRGAQFLIPVASGAVPGLGQYIYALGQPEWPIPVPPSQRFC